MNWPTPLEPAIFVGRDNRFRATVIHQGAPAAAHVPNSGRLSELFVRGAKVWVAPAPAERARRTACDIVLVEYAGALVSVDARLPNRLVAEALAQGRLPPFAGYRQVKPEVAVGGSRLDFLLYGRGPATATAGRAGPAKQSVRCWLETKSVTLVENGTALFPDAPTERGLRHLRELAELRSAGDEVAVLFVVQRSDATAFAPHPTAHPAFAAALRDVQKQGVSVYAWRCRVSLAGSTLTDPIAVEV